MNYKAALVALTVVGVALLMAGAILFTTLKQKESETLPNWTNARLLEELGTPDASFDCGGLDPTLKGLLGTNYVDNKNQRLLLICVAAPPGIAG